MNKAKLGRYRKNKTELALTDKSIARLQDELANVEVISGKVTKSDDEFPYIEGHMTVQMAEPMAATRIRQKIREKEKRRETLLQEIKEVDNFIYGMPEGIDKEIFEMVFIDGYSYQKAGTAVGYSKGRVSQIISKNLKD